MPSGRETRKTDSRSIIVDVEGDNSTWQAEETPAVTPDRMLRAKIHHLFVTAPMQLPMRTEIRAPAMTPNPSPVFLIDQIWPPIIATPTRRTTTPNRDIDPHHLIFPHPRILRERILVIPGNIFLNDRCY